MIMITITRTQIMLGGTKKPKWKEKIPCKLCKNDHLTHLCPRMEDASKFIAQCPVVFTNPLPNNQNMNSRTVVLVMLLVELKTHQRPLVATVASTW